MQLSKAEEQAAQSGWQDAHAAVELPSGWNVPLGQEERGWQEPFTTSEPEGQEVQKSAEPEQVAQPDEQAGKGESASGFEQGKKEADLGRWELCRLC